MRFQLIDQVIEHSPDRLVAVKAVSSAEEYLWDHFPGFHILPGVMMLEAMVQAARKLVRLAEGPTSPGPLVVSEVRNVRYAAMVRPGQHLTVEVHLRQRTDEGFDFQGTGTVEGQMAVQGRFSLVPQKYPASYAQAR